MNSSSSNNLRLTIASTIVFGIFQFCWAQDATPTFDSTRPLTNAPTHQAGLQKIESEDDDSFLSKGLLPDGRIIVHTAHSDSEQKIFKALDTISNFEFPGNPLVDVIEFLASQYEIPILIAENQLKAMKLSDDLEVKLVISGVTLGDGLSLLLASNGLGVVVQNGALVVTSQEAAQAYTETRVYNVRALNVTNPAALTNVLTSTTGTRSWGQSGGTGNLCYFNGSIVVQQNQATHRQIETVLNQLLLDVQNSADSPDWSAINTAGGGFY